MARHVEFLRGLQNPLGMKVGPTQEPDDLLRILDILNPRNEAGRITLISRMGADKVAARLPALVRAVEREGRKVRLAVRPDAWQHHQHAGTMVKTRNFDSILAEVRGFFDVHAAEGTWAGGVHVEMTGQDVTECIGGAHRPVGSRSERALRDVLRSAPERRTVAGTRVPGRRGTEASPPAACRAGARSAVGRVVSRTGEDLGADITARTDSYFNRTKTIVGRFGDKRVTYALFLRRPVICAPRLMLDWLTTVADRRGTAIDVDLIYQEGDWVGAGEPIVYLTGSMVASVGPGNHPAAEDRPGLRRRA